MRHLVFAVATLGSAIAAHADEPVYFLMTGESFACLQQHQADYAPDGADDTVFITVASCGEASATEVDLFDQVLNSAPNINIVDDGTPDPVVALTGADFRCLTALELPDDAKLIAFFPQDCNVEVRK